MDSFIKNALYVVSTPIGNLKDITLRAIEVLNSVDIILAEDTRTTSVLLDKYSIKTKLISYHKYNENEKSDLFLNYLKEGQTLALVSDAGTPLISDPGNILVKKVRQEGYRIIPITGISAVTALLSSINREEESFKFIGFLPKEKNKIIKIFNENYSENLVFYESPLRLIATLEILKEEFKNKKIAIGRELTKKFEEIIVDRVDKVLEYFKNNTLKGEIVVMLYKDDKKDDINLMEKIKKLKALGYKDKEISNILSELFEVKKNEVYKLAVNN